MSRYRLKETLYENSLKGVDKLTVISNLPGNSVIWIGGAEQSSLSLRYYPKPYSSDNRYT